MKTLLIIVLIILVLGLLFFTPQTKVFIGMVVRQLAPLKEAVANAIIS